MRRYLDDGGDLSSPGYHQNLIKLLWLLCAGTSGTENLGQPPKGRVDEVCDNRAPKALNL
jgi:hypothetical protein